MTSVEKVFLQVQALEEQYNEIQQNVELNNKNILQLKSDTYSVEAEHRQDQKRLRELLHTIADYEVQLESEEAHHGHPISSSNDVMTDQYLSNEEEHSHGNRSPILGTQEAIERHYTNATENFCKGLDTLFQTKLDVLSQFQSMLDNITLLPTYQKTQADLQNAVRILEEKIRKNRAVMAQLNAGLSISNEVLSNLQTEQRKVISSLRLTTNKANALRVQHSRFRQALAKTRYDCDNHESIKELESNVENALRENHHHRALYSELEEEKRSYFATNSSKRRNASTSQAKRRRM